MIQELLKEYYTKLTSEDNEEIDLIKYIPIIDYLDEKEKGEFYYGLYLKCKYSDLVPEDILIDPYHIYNGACVTIYFTT